MNHNPLSTTAALRVFVAIVVLGAAIACSLGPRQRSMLLHARVAACCGWRAAVCRVDLASLMPFEWDRVVFVGAMPNEDIGELIGIPTLPGNGVVSWILFLREDHVVWTDQLENEPEGNPQHIFVDLDQLHNHSVLVLTRQNAVFDARKEYGPDVPWLRSSIKLRHVPTPESGSTGTTSGKIPL